MNSKDRCRKRKADPVQPNNSTKKKTKEIKATVERVQKECKKGTDKASETEKKSS